MKNLTVRDITVKIKNSVEELQDTMSRISNPKETKRPRKDIYNAITEISTSQRKSLHGELKNLAITTSRRGLAGVYVNVNTCELGSNVDKL